MFIFCKLLNGTHKYIEIFPNTTFGCMKEKISESENIPKSLIWFTYQSKCYPDNTKLVDVGICNDSTIQLYIKYPTFCRKCSKN
jgi:hypothetical protein